MALENVNEVDAISTDSEEKKVILTIVDELDWADEYNHLKLIQDKANNYLNFIESNELHKAYPMAKGKEIEIEIYLKYELTLSGQRLISKIKEFLYENGYEFNCRKVGV
jgi:hypothetical protein